MTGESFTTGSARQRQGLTDERPVSVIVNTGSGAGSDAERLRQLERSLHAAGLSFRLVAVSDGEQIVQAARTAVKSGSRVVVAAGGDGTVSAVASQLADTDVVMGVLPIGTLNHFAKDAGIPVDPEDALRVITQSNVMHLDCGEVNGRVFINNSSLGLYPDIVTDRESQRRREGRGKWHALFSASLRALRRFSVLTLQIEVDGQAYQRRSAFFFVGNNEYRMEGFNIGERESIAKGRLSLYLTRHTGRFGLFRLALRALLGRLRQSPDFEMVTVMSLTVRSRKHRLLVATDGEVQSMQPPLHYRIRPKALRVLVPRP
jgi:diacylglycerol kinase family enzyme